MNTSFLRTILLWMGIFSLFSFSCETTDEVIPEPSPFIPPAEEAVVPFADFIAPEAWDNPGRALEAEVVPGIFAKVQFERGLLFFRLKGQESRGLEIVFTPHGIEEAWKARYFPQEMFSQEGMDWANFQPDEQGVLSFELEGQTFTFGLPEAFLSWEINQETQYRMTAAPRFYNQRTIWPLFKKGEGQTYHGLGTLAGPINRAGGQYHLYPEHEGQALMSRFLLQSTNAPVQDWKVFSGTQSYYNFQDENPWVGQLSGPLHLEVRLGEVSGQIPESWGQTQVAYEGDSRMIPLWMLGHHRVFGGDAPQIEFLDRVQNFRSLRAPLDGVIYSPGTGFREGMLPTNEVGFVHKLLGQYSTKPMIWLNEESWKSTDTWVNAGLESQEYLGPYNQWLSKDVWGFFWYAEERAPQTELWGENIDGIPFREAIRDLGSRRQQALSQDQNSFVGGRQRPVIPLDEDSDRAEVLHQALNAAVSFGANSALWVRGHRYESQEEWLRNMELAVFMPFFLSEGDLEQDPLWKLDTAFYRRWTALIKERYKLIPYYFQSLVEARGNNQPLLRPVFWDYGEDPETWGIQDQYMIGKDLMVAPILEKGSDVRRLYLPKGEKWFVWRSGEELPAGRWLEVRVPVGQPLVIARGGTVIPSGFPGEIAEETKRFLEEYHYFPGQTAKLTRYWAQIDGQLMENTEKIITEVTATMTPREIRLDHQKVLGAPPRVPAALVRFRRVRKPRRVLFDGVPIAINGPSYGVTESDIVTSWYEEDGSLLVKVFRPNAGFELVLEY